MASDAEQLTITERAFVVAILVADGEELLTREIADLLTMSPNGAYRLMARASRVVPIIQNADGRWRLYRAE